MTNASEDSGPAAPATSVNGVEQVEEKSSTAAAPNDTPASAPAIAVESPPPPPTPVPSTIPKTPTARAPTPVTPAPPTTAAAAPATGDAQHPKEAGSSAALEKAREHLNDYLKNKIAAVAKDKLRVVLNEYDSMKEKTSKLKSLLGRSAKAQREAKVDLDAATKKLDVALKEVERLTAKVDKLATRPTHLELLADFETNFDRALLSVGANGSGGTSSQSYGQQSGGESTAPPMDNKEDNAVVDNLLMQELNDSKQRIDKLESLYAALMHRSNLLEGEAKERKRERDELKNQVSRLELEKRMAVMEAEHATRAMQEKAASLAEMQMEIDMVTRASVSANARAAQGEEMMKHVKTDKHHVQQLESQLQALQEWATASTEAKILAQERVRLLENQLRSLQNRTLEAIASDSKERILLTKSASLVVGAADVGFRVVSLDEEMIRSVRLSDRVFLRWKFDLTQEDATIEFSVVKSVCDTVSKFKSNVDFLLKERTVQGGAAGETDNAFAIQGSCTLCFSNLSSWIRPKTVKYEIQAVVVAD